MKWKVLDSKRGAVLTTNSGTVMGGLTRSTHFVVGCVTKPSGAVMINGITMSLLGLYPSVGDAAKAIEREVRAFLHSGRYPNIV